MRKSIYSLIAIKLLVSLAVVVFWHAKAQAAEVGINLCSTTLALFN